MTRNVIRANLTLDERRNFSEKYSIHWNDDESCSAQGLQQWLPEQNEEGLGQARVLQIIWAMAWVVRVARVFEARMG